MDFSNDQRLIEAGFPCHQVGAETQRERGASSALPPLYYLHVWWARRPLTPSRAAILASLLPADADSEEFVKGLGIRLQVAEVGGVGWVLNEAKLRDRVTVRDGQAILEVDGVIHRALIREQEARYEQQSLIGEMLKKTPELAEEEAIQKWQQLVQDFPYLPQQGERLHVHEEMGDPAWFKELMGIAKKAGFRVPNLYGYDRAYLNSAPLTKDPKVILDPTAGGGSIPFEALRLGHKVIANELNPVASVILKATLDYPARFGHELLKDIQRWGDNLESALDARMKPFFPSCDAEIDHSHPKAVNRDTSYLYCRQVTCPHCAGDAPLLNSLWLSKEGEKWGVAVKPQPDRTVRFEPFKVTNDNCGPNGEDLDAGTVSGGVGQCVHCHQAISGDEIKRQARGESELGKWKDVLYCVVGIRLEPKLDRHGKVQRFASGERKGEIKTAKVRYFRAANQADLDALKAAEQELEERRLEFEMKGLVPNEPIPVGSKTSEPIRYGMNSWADMFTPRQLLGHLTVMDELHDAKPRIVEALGEDKGRAVITYLQFALDKVLDYNSRQTLWHAARGVIAHVFTRHDFSFKWTFGEMVYAGPSSGIKWGVSQILDAYSAIEKLVPDSGDVFSSERLKIIQGSASNIASVEDKTVDAVVMDPPYYNNVQYAELSDFFYVWQKKTLGDLYPGWFDQEVTDKASEAVSNPSRDGSTKSAKARYEELMQGIFAESKRVLKPDGIMTLMFTHKSSDAWETLTNSLIQSGWDITSCYPVESEGTTGIHQKDVAAAASSIMIAARPTNRGNREPSSWAYEVKGKLEAAVRDGLGEFERLKLNPVDRMIASWGRALRVYSAHWPVQDGDDEVPPTRAMQEAARVVAEEEVSRLSGGLVTVDDLDAESRLAVIALGINGLGDFAFDDALQMSRSLNFRLQNRNGNYRVSDDMVAYANVGEDERAAPLVIRGNKLRLLKPEERAATRLENPQTLWDVLGGLIITYREGGIVAARNYLSEHGKRDSDALRGLLKVWAKECRDDELRREAQLIDYEL
jgi:adenine-specific DNA methylase